jgi:Tfp pilus assembly protein PilF
MKRYQSETSPYKPIPGIETILFGDNLNLVQAEVDRSLRETLSGGVELTPTKNKTNEQRSKRDKNRFTGEDIIGTSNIGASRISITDSSKLTPAQKAYLEAQLFIDQKSWIQAAEALERTIKFDPGKQVIGWINTLLGIVYFKLNDFDSAAKAFKKAIEINPKDGVSYFHLATLYMMKYIHWGNNRELSKAIKHFETAILLLLGLCFW